MPRALSLPTHLLRLPLTVGLILLAAACVAPGPYYGGGTVVYGSYGYPGVFYGEPFYGTPYDYPFYGPFYGPFYSPRVRRYYGGGYPGGWEHHRGSSHWQDHSGNWHGHAGNPGHWRRSGLFRNPGSGYGRSIVHGGGQHGRGRH